LLYLSMDSPPSSNSLNRLPSFPSDTQYTQTEPDYLPSQNHVKHFSNYKEWDNRLLGDIKRTINSTLKGFSGSKTHRGMNPPYQVKFTSQNNQANALLGIQSNSTKDNEEQNIKANPKGFKFIDQSRTPKFALEIPVDSMQDEDWDTGITAESERIPKNFEKNLSFGERRRRNSQSTNITMISNDGDCESVAPTSEYGRKIPSQYSKQNAKITPQDLEGSNEYEKEILGLRQELVKKDIQMKGLVDLVKMLEKELSKAKQRNDKEGEALDSMRESISRELQQIQESTN